jgi:hypothetical protein
MQITQKNQCSPKKKDDVAHSQHAIGINKQDHMYYYNTSKQDQIKLINKIIKIKTSRLIS